MRNLIVFILLLAFVLPALAGPTKPKKGTYEFTQTHTVKVATKYAGGRGEDPNPVEWDERTYKPGETIKVSDFFWNDKDKTWGAKLVFHGQNLSIPLSKLKPVQ